MGSYKELSSRPDGAFTKLMEWQMSGGEPTGNDLHKFAIDPENKGPPTERDEIEAALDDKSEGESEGEEELEGSKVQETVKKAVSEKKTSSGKSK